MTIEVKNLTKKFGDFAALDNVDLTLKSLRRVIGLRTLPISILSRIPFVGWLIALADSLMIFGAERRCLHDVFADSIVIND